MRQGAWRVAAAALTLALLVHVGLTLRRKAQAPYQCEMSYMHASYQIVNITSSLQGRYSLYSYIDTEVSPQHGAAHMALELRLAPSAQMLPHCRKLECSCMTV